MKMWAVMALATLLPFVVPSNFFEFLPSLHTRSLHVNSQDVYPCLSYFQCVLGIVRSPSFFFHLFTLSPYNRLFTLSPYNRYLYVSFLFRNCVVRDRHYFISFVFLSIFSLVPSPFVLTLVK